MNRIPLHRSLWLCLLACWAAVPGFGQPSTGDAEQKFYRLQAGDEVRITVFNEPDLAVQQKLDPDGVLIVPLLGRTALAGMTLREAETRLEELYITGEYLITPQVTVTVAAFAEQVFYIFGEVNQPGAKPFPQGRQSLDILEAMTMGGGLTQYAKRSEIVIRRPVPDENREEKIVVNLDTAIRGNRQGAEELMTIYPNDIIFVPERLF